MNRQTLRFRAFISYSHQDSGVAKRLHRKLESYRAPKQVENTLHTGRIRPVFRDREELGSASSLSTSIEAALDDSAAMIVICSPAAVASPWVNAEIDYFRRQHPERPVLAFVVSGEPVVDPRADPAGAAFPLKLALLNLDKPDGALADFIAADARQEGDGFSSAFLKLVAGLLQVPYDQLRQREAVRRHRQWTLALSVSITLASVFAVLAWRATIARNEAREARAQAELELTSERQTREFLLSLFQLADPGEARGNEVTVREVLDQAVARIDSTEFSRPVIKSRFLATMGQAYSSLGNNRRSIELLQESLAALPAVPESVESWKQRIDSELELADVQFSMGEYDAALLSLDGISTGNAFAHMSLAQQASAANIHGDILSYTEQDEAAMAAYQSALDLAETAVLTAEEDAYIRSRSLGGIALLNHFSGDFAESQRQYGEAVSILMPVFGTMHPDTIWAMLSWGSAAYSNGDTRTARDAWTRTLSLATRVLGETHPEVGTIKNNLARLMFETGAYDEAETMLRDALGIDRVSRSENFDDLAYPLNNLALVRMAKGDRVEAEALLLEALPVAEASHHRMLGPILIGLADVQCQSGQADGISNAQRALEIISAEFGEQDWQRQQALMTLSYCRALNGKEIDQQAADAALCALISRWGDQSYFSVRATEQRNAIFQASASNKQNGVTVLPFRPSVDNC